MKNENNTYLFYYEGECEKALIDFLRQEKKYLKGKTKKFNFFKENVNKILRTLNPHTVICVVFDTDKSIELNSELNRFIENIKKLSQSNGVVEVILFQQLKDFEDELIYAAKGSIKSKEHLKKIFNQPGIRNFKSEFSKNTKNAMKKLEKSGLDYKLLWSRELIDSLNPLKEQEKIRKFDYKDFNF